MDAGITWLKIWVVKIKAFNECFLLSLLLFDWRYSKWQSQSFLLKSCNQLFGVLPSFLREAESWDRKTPGITRFCFFQYNRPTPKTVNFQTHQTFSVYKCCLEYLAFLPSLVSEVNSYLLGWVGWFCEEKSKYWIKDMSGQKILEELCWFSCLKLTW